MSVIAANAPASAGLVHAPETVAPTHAVSIEPVSARAWDDAIADFDTLCQEQIHAFAATRWPGVIHEPMLFHRAGEIVGGTLVMVQRLPLKLASIAVVKWGPMLKRADDPDAPVLHAAMVERLVEIYARQRGMMLSILPWASTAPCNAHYDQLIASGFKPGSVLLFPNRYIVDLGPEPAVRRKSLHQKWRYHLSKAEKAGLSFEHADRAEMAQFHALYLAMTDRKQFSDHSAYETIDQMMALDPPALRPELFFVRDETGDIIAGALVFTAGQRAVYLYGATNDRALPLRAGYFLQWHIVNWLRQNTKARWYDLGGTDGYQGLHQFKKGLVGEAGVIEPVPPVANYAARPLAYALGAGAFAARDAWHDVKRKIHAWRNPQARPGQTRDDSDTARAP